ncbi:MAG: ion transporter [Phycisphaeraceae bacterium]|nr:ion transporter [Phycisphaeraceae bacterium]
MSDANNNPTTFAPWRARLHEIIFEADDRKGRLFDTVLIVAILASVVVIILDSVQSIREGYHTLFIALEWFFTVLFTVEYVLRLVCVRKPLRYVFSFYGIVDLLSILPSYIGLFVPGAQNLMVIRMLRLLRIFRVFKLVRFLGEADALRRAFYASRHKIAVFLTTVLIIITIMAAAMHVIETRAGNDKFSSLPEAMYWAVVTMTTVGYGDITPITVMGKFLSATMMLIGYSMIIVPAGILSGEIAAESQRHARRSTTQHCTNCSRDGHEFDAIYCKFCGEHLNPQDTSDHHLDES